MRLPATEGTIHCEVCGDPLLQVDSLTRKKGTPFVCRSSICRIFVSDRAGLDSLHYQYQLKQYQNTRLQRDMADAQTKAQREEMEKIYLAENQSILKKVLKTQSKSLRQTPHMASVSSGGWDQVTLSEERVTKYRSHLASLIDSSFSEQPAEDSPDPDEKEFIDPAGLADNPEQNPVLSKLCVQACTVCQGGCCSTGGNQAYLTVSTINRVRQSRPELSATEVLDLYLSHVAGKSAENACINKSESGCALPRELRSDTCNSYFCDDLKNLITRFENEAHIPPVLLVKRAHRHFNRFHPGFDHQVVDVVLIDDDNIQPTDF